MKYWDGRNDKLFSAYLRAILAAALCGVVVCHSHFSHFQNELEPKDKFY